MKRKIFLTSVITILVCLCIITGATFALFTSESPVNISVVAGQVKVDASMTVNDVSTRFESYAPVHEEVIDTDSDNNGIYYFENKGTATLVNGQTLELDRITPGDKVNLYVNIDNKSNVAIKYLVVAEILPDPDTTKPSLKDVIVVKINGQSIGATGTSYIPQTWSNSLAPNANISNLPVSVWLPDDIGSAGSKDDNNYQNGKVQIKFTVYAIQANVTNSVAYNEFGITDPTAVNP